MSRFSLTMALPLLFLWGGCAGGKGALFSEATSGRVFLRCTPSDAVVLLDGVQQGVCSDFAGEARSMRVGAGLHRVEVRKQGHLPFVAYCDPGVAAQRMDVSLAPAAGDGAE
jgi:hypothetical protein